jgi:hypothetical protein
MLLRPFRSFSSVSSFTHTLDNGIVKVEPAKPEQLSTHGKGTKFAVVMVQGLSVCFVFVFVFVCLFFFFFFFSFFFLV